MRVHIKAISTTTASNELLALFKDKGGSWVVHAFGAEGYVAGLLGTRFGDALMKYGTDESFAGVFDGKASLKDMRQAMAAAREAYSKVHGEPRKPAQHAVVDRRGGSGPAFIPMHVMALEAFTERGAMDTNELAAALKCSPSAAQASITKLRTTGKIVEVGKRPRPPGSHGGVARAVFGAVELAA